MAETWYRAEAVGVATASGGSTDLHDLGDGMYLTDNEGVAKEYAQLRTSNPTKQRIYSVRIDRSSLRILDLTTDLRWRKLVKPVEPLLRLGTANKNYGQTFVNFIRTYKIDLSQYDAVIGHEYVRGGKQMCILHKNGSPSRVQVAIRRKFRPLAPITTRVRTLTSKIQISGRAIRIGSRIRGGFSGVKGGFFAIGIDIGLHFLAKWAMQATVEDIIEGGLEEANAKIQQKLEGMKQEIASFQLQLDEREKTFAVATIEIHFIKHRGARRGSYIKPYVILREEIALSTKEVNSESEHPSRERGGQTVVRLVKSQEVAVYTDEELKVFRELAGEYLEYKRLTLRYPANQVFRDEARKRRQEIVRVFGENISLLKNEYMAAGTG